MLWFWVVVLVALIGAIAVVAAGRGDSMVEVYDDRADAGLPSGRPLNAEDLRAVRLNTGMRGYRMDEVDALLARLEAEMIEREDEREDDRDEGVRVVGASVQAEPTLVLDRQTTAALVSEPAAPVDEVEASADAAADEPQDDAPGDRPDHESRDP